jgi:hypothetical protein
MSHQPSYARLAMVPSSLFVRVAQEIGDRCDLDHTARSLSPPCGLWRARSNEARNTAPCLETARCLQSLSSLCGGSPSLAFLGTEVRAPVHSLTPVKDAGRARLRAGGEKWGREPLLFLRDGPPGGWPSERPATASFSQRLVNGPLTSPLDVFGVPLWSASPSRRAPTAPSRPRC